MQEKHTLANNINHGCIPLRGGPGVVCAGSLEHLTGTNGTDYY